MHNWNEGVFLGKLAGNTTGTGSIGNIGIGNQALMNFSTGIHNVGVGDGALYNVYTAKDNVAIGFKALPDVSAGANNVAIGSLAGFLYHLTDSNNIAIMSQGVAGESNAIRIGSPGGQLTCYIAGIVGVTTANSQMVTIDSTNNQLGVAAIPTTLSWSVITASQSAVAGQGYFVNGVGAVTVTLPATSAIGDIFEVSNMGIAAGTIIAQNAGQDIRIGSSTTTPGVGGSLTSTALGDSLKLVCNVANTTWTVVSSMGNWSIV